MSIQSKEDLLYYLEQDRIALKRPAGFVLQKTIFGNLKFCSERQSTIATVCWAS